MIISPDGKTVRFKTEAEGHFNSEKSGAKPNTVRIIDHYECKQLKKKLPEKIMIEHGQEIFLRTVTHVYVSERIFGKYLAVFSWTNEAHHHAMPVGPHSVPVELGPHNASVDSVLEVPIIQSICKYINCVKYNEIKDDFHVHTMSLDELAPVLLPRTVIHALGRHRQGKSHADFIKVLLIDYLGKLAEGEGSDHGPRITPTPIAKTMRCPDCDGDLLKSKAGEFGKCAICQAMFSLDLGAETSTEERGPVHD